MKKGNSTLQTDSKKYAKRDTPDWLASLVNEFNQSGSNIPEDAVTAQQIREDTGFGECKTYRFIRERIKAGRLRAIRTSVWSEDHNKFVQRTFYVPVREKAQGF